MAIANHLVYQRWVAQIHSPGSEHRSMDGRSVSATPDTIFSYGWWPMAEMIRPNRSNGHFPAFALVNGDRYSSTTTRHQGIMRNALRWANATQLLVPFTALDAARIDHQSIRPLEINEDTFTEQMLTVPRHQLRTSQSVWREGTCPIRHTWTPGNRAYECSGDHGKYEQVPVDPPTYWDGRMTANAKPDQEISPNVYRLPFFRHWLGESVFEATVADRGRRRYRARFLSAFDRLEAGQIYFLAQLPKGSTADTVDKAIDDLAPGVVKYAWAQGIKVERQGDIFAVQCHLPREITDPAPFRRVTSGQFANWDRNRSNGNHPNRLLGTDHTASEVLRPASGEIYARGIIRHEPARRDADHAQITLDGWHLIVRNTVPA